MKRIEALRNTIKAHLDSELSSKDFTDVETVLALFERYASGKDARQAFLLLHNYSLIGKSLPTT